MVVLFSDNDFNIQKTYVKQPLSNRPKIGFKDQLSFNASQKYCRMLQYFRPFDHLSSRYLLYLFLSGCYCMPLKCIIVLNFAIATVLIFVGSAPLSVL